MRSPSYSAARRTTRAVLVLALAAGLATAVPAAQAAAPATHAAKAAHAPDAPAAPAAGVAAKPYMGWSSWSMQSSKYPGLNPDGDYSYLTESQRPQADGRPGLQAQAVRLRLRQHRRRLVADKADWKPEFDAYGRQTADAVRFPHGMKPVADHIHEQGPQGGHLPARPAWRRRRTARASCPSWNADGCTTADIVYRDLRTTNGWDSAYKLDFSSPCAQKYVDSQAQMFADWGYDFLKLDGVGPGSGKTGDNYDNVADVAAWQKAIAAAGRPVHLEISWSLDIGHAADWKQYSNGWRIDTDVECYCNTLVSWENSVDDRFDDAPGVEPQRGPRRLERPRLPRRRQRRDGRPHQGRAAELHDAVGHRQVAALHRRRPHQARLLRRCPC